LLPIQRPFFPPQVLKVQSADAWKKQCPTKADLASSVCLMPLPPSLRVLPALSFEFLSTRNCPWKVRVRVLPLWFFSQFHVPSYVPPFVQELRSFFFRYAVPIPPLDSPCLRFKLAAMNFAVAAVGSTPRGDRRNFFISSPPNVYLLFKHFR